MCTSQTISLPSFGNPPFSPPWTVDFNMGSILPIPGGAVGESQGLGWVFCLFLHFAYSIFYLRLFAGTCHETLLCCGGTSSDETQTWGHSAAHCWVFPGAKLRTELSLKLFFPWTKAAKFLAHGNLSTSASHSLYPHCWKSQLFSQCEENFFLFFLLCSILE